MRTVFCRSFVSHIEKAVQDAKDEEEAQLARNYRKADLEQIVAKLQKDFTVLDGLATPDAKKNEEHALDMKYMRERQQQLVSDNSQDDVLSLFLKSAICHMVATFNVKSMVDCDSDES